jgi:hypothetical protein
LEGENCLISCKTSVSAGNLDELPRLAQHAAAITVFRTIVEYPGQSTLPRVDKGLKGKITYEPDLLPDGRKIDFVADRGRDNAYIEVKTVHPDIADTEAAWKNYEKRKKLHPKNANFIVKKDWMGGRLYGNTFASRSRFLEYTLDFEMRTSSGCSRTPWHTS